MVCDPEYGTRLSSVDDAQRGLLLALVDDAITALLDQIGDCPACVQVIDLGERVRDGVIRTGPCAAHLELAGPWQRYWRLSVQLDAAAGRSLCPLDDDQAAVIARAIPAALARRDGSTHPVSAALAAAYAELGRQLARGSPGMITRS